MVLIFLLTLLGLARAILGELDRWNDVAGLQPEPGCCPRCRRPAEVHWLLCPGCRTLLQQGCAVCGRQVPVFHRYCCHCGEDRKGLRNEVT